MFASGDLDFESNDVRIIYKYDYDKALAFMECKSPNSFGIFNNLCIKDFNYENFNLIRKRELETQEEE